MVRAVALALMALSSNAIAQNSTDPAIVRAAVLLGKCAGAYNYLEFEEQISEMSKQALDLARASGNVDMAFELGDRFSLNHYLTWREFQDKAGMTSSDGANTAAIEFIKERKCNSL